VLEATHPAVAGGQRKLSRQGVYAARAWLKNTARAPNGGTRWRAASWPPAPSAGPAKRRNREASLLPHGRSHVRLRLWPCPCFPLSATSASSADRRRCSGPAPIRNPHSAIDCRRRHGTICCVDVWGAHPVPEVTHPAVGGGQLRLSKDAVHAARAWFRNTVRVPDGGSRWLAASWPPAPSAGPDKRRNREASLIFRAGRQPSRKGVRPPTTTYCGSWRPGGSPTHRGDCG
jgi:hypothetical protein